MSIRDDINIYGYRCRSAIAIVSTVMLVAIPFLSNEYTQYIINLIIINALVGVGFNIIIGFLGQLAFANAALFGIGAYTAAIVMDRLSFPYVIALGAAGVAGAIAGALISIPALRGIRSYYLAILTMAFGELMRFIYIHAEALTAGSTGLQVPPASFIGVPLDTQTKLYYVFLAVAGLLIVISAQLIRSRVGRAICATRDNELAAATLGVPTATYFVLAFTWSGFIVAIAGAMFAVLIGRVVPESFNLIQLILHFAIVIVGGLGSFIGPIIGAVLLTVTPEVFRAFPGGDEVVFGALILFVLIFMPRGIAGFIERLSPALAQRFYRR